ncbi:DegT/DnrJ/EryC1/StrS family aminotransferase [Pseudomonas sp. TH03]|uniref:DegT/DnrJ/EryC1/StrS family aminotransferase n=1 Tax=Pseudomonas sp. TH03 TaxID=2796369 RepID=UPI001914BA43|nr:DegT/DnrJ/EryC1/StrS family aminotransferase [Pseudomonas sp. TH03]MBK5552225.1 DegT/DnrJ/EryC1/StrS family aminotransferase [Pseudomonas sp. TH03]
MNITVTKPFVPPFGEFQTYLQGVWEREWFTNNGPLVNELELKLKEKLDVDHLLFLSNGTIALQIAIRALDLQGEIITTPFSYVATTSSIVWERCKPVMVDIDVDTLNIDPSKIEQAITPKTTAILATHVFGNPCDVEAIELVAKKYGLSVIYDAAHAFGTRYKERSLLAYGDIATCSFHATKLFHTIEGGAVTTSNPEILKNMAMMRNFGHSSLTEFGGVGVNGKNSEVHAAMGLTNLKYLEDILAVRKELCDYYKSSLTDLPIVFQKIAPDTEYNNAYFPVIFESEAMLLHVIEALNLNNVYPRRYFYPSLSELPYVHDQSSPISEDISRRILCLPLYHTLSREEVDMICRLVKRSIRY